MQLVIYIKEPYEEGAMNKFKKIYKMSIYNSTQYWGITILSIVVSYLGLGLALMFGELVSMVSLGKTFADMTVMIIVTVLTTLTFSFISWFYHYSSSNFFVYNVYELRNKYVNKLLATKYSLLSSDDSSRYINNITSDINSVVSTYSDCSRFFIVNIFTLVGAFFAAVLIDWRIALSMVGFTLIMSVLPLFVKKPLDKSIGNQSVKNQDYLRSLKENLLGLTVIKNNNAEDVCEQSIKSFNLSDLKSKKKRNFIESVAGGMSVLIKYFAILSLILITCYLVTIDKVKIGAILSIYAIGNTFYDSILDSSWIVTRLVSMRSVREKVEEIIDRKTDDSNDIIHFEQEIKLSNISFRYQEDEERLILDDVSLSIKKNCKYLIIGSSGSGKSTILKLMCKFYDNYQGEIGVDGVNYNNYSEKEINSSIAYCQQNGYLFNRSFKDNIDFNYTNNMDRLDEVIKLVQLEDFVNKLPNKMDTVIDEEVNQVSGGEKLRINLARSLFRDSDILLLDEITSALDKKTSEIIENNILNLDKTIINVCHKFNDKTLELYDKIFIIENGRIAEEGVLDELKNSPRFAKYRNKETS